MTEIVVHIPGLPPLSNLNFAGGLYLADLVGWAGRPSPRRANEQRPYGDGDFDDDPLYLDSRLITCLIRTARQDAPDEIFADDALISAVGNSREPFEFSVDIAGESRRALVSIAGPVDPDMDYAPGMAEWELSLKADDPRKYWPLQTPSTGLPIAGTGVISPVTSPFTDGEPGTPGRITLTNQGTAESTPVLRVSGGLSDGFELTAIEKGRRIRVERQIVEDSTIRIDMDTGQLWINETSPISGALVVREWWTVQPGETVTVQFTGLGTSTGQPVLSAEFASADR